VPPANPKELTMKKITLALGLAICFSSVALAQRGGRGAGPAGEVGKPFCINQDDIEHIEILKGPAAAAAYGGNVTNGFIIIRTKTPSTQVFSNQCGSSASSDDPFARYLFPPELVMSNQQAIKLTDSQRSAMQSAMRDAQMKFVDLQLQMSGASEKLQRLLQGTSIDEARLLEQVDQVLSVERSIKRTQLTLMARIKNQLTEQQQNELRQNLTSSANRQDGPDLRSP
jgi:TonB-dependent SusC/RagA subfamily outer membrane receptor